MGGAACVTDGCRPTTARWVDTIGAPRTTPSNQRRSIPHDAWPPAPHETDDVRGSALADARVRGDGARSRSLQDSNTSMAAFLRIVDRFWSDQATPRGPIPVRYRSAPGARGSGRDPQSIFERRC